MEYDQKSIFYFFRDSAIYGLKIMVVEQKYDLVLNFETYFERTPSDWA